MSKLKCFPNSLDITQFGNANDFLVACSVLRGASLSTFEIFDVARGQGRAFCSFDY